MSFTEGHAVTELFLGDDHHDERCGRRDDHRNEMTQPVAQLWPVSVCQYVTIITHQWPLLCCWVVSWRWPLWREVRPERWPQEWNDTASSWTLTRTASAARPRSPELHRVTSPSGGIWTSRESEDTRGGGVHWVRWAPNGNLNLGIVSYITVELKKKPIW